MINEDFDDDSLDDCDADAAPACLWPSDLAYLEDELAWVAARCERIGLERRRDATPEDRAFRRAGFHVEDERLDPHVLAQRIAEVSGRERTLRSVLDARLWAQRHSGRELGLDRLARVHALDDFERTVLLLAAGPCVSRRFERLYAQLEGERQQSLTVDVAFAFAELPAAERVARRRALGPRGRLVANDFIEMRFGRAPTPKDLLATEIELRGRTFSLLLGDNGLGDELADLVRLEDARATFDRVVLPDENRRRILAAVDGRERLLEAHAAWGLDTTITYGRGTILLFDGPPGTGKTLCAHAVAAHGGQRVMNVDAASFSAHEDGGSFIPALFREARLQNALLFFDECETLLSSRRLGTSRRRTRRPIGVGRRRQAMLSAGRSSASPTRRATRDETPRASSPSVSGPTSSVRPARRRARSSTSSSPRRSGGERTVAIMPRSDLPAHTSASQLATYARCPRAYAYKYIEHRDPEVRFPGTALGSAIHSAIAWWFDARAQEHEPTIDTLLGVLRADLAAATAFTNMRWREVTPEKLEAEAERLLRFFITEKGDLPVKESEVRFDFVIIDPDTGEQMPRPIIGYFDAELANGNLIELKTAKRAYSEVDLRVGIQFACSRTAARHYGVDVELMAIVRNKTPKLQYVVLPHDRDVSRWFMRAAAAIERAILSGHFPPAPGMACSSCEYRRACLGVEAETVDDEAEAA